MINFPFVSGRSAAEDALSLLANFGDFAGQEAAQRADAARDIGNHINFCHWRQIERLVVMLGTPQILGTVH
jgi:hypothetical protein